MNNICEGVCNARSHFMVYFILGVLQMWQSATVLQLWAREIQSLMQRFHFCLSLWNSKDPYILFNWAKFHQLWAPLLLIRSLKQTWCLFFWISMSYFPLDEEAAPHPQPAAACNQSVVLHGAAPLLHNSSLWDVMVSKGSALSPSRDRLISALHC